MRRVIKRSKVKTTIYYPGGRKKKITVPLTVETSNRQNNSTEDSESSFETFNTDDHPVDEAHGGTSKDAFRKSNRFLNWTKVSEELFTAYVESLVLPETPCRVCSNTTATIRCVECGPGWFFCRECATESHRFTNQLHVLDLWQVSK
jgi:hypothetical protein